MFLDIIPLGIRCVQAGMQRRRSDSEVSAKCLHYRCPHTGIPEECDNSHTNHYAWAAVAFLTECQDLVAAEQAFRGGQGPRCIPAFTHPIPPGLPRPLKL